jgi:hypothetical protein
MTSLYPLLSNEKPAFGRIKLIECGFYTQVLDCNGGVQPMSYCAAVRDLKGLGFHLEMRGKNEKGQDFEIWRLPVEQDSRNEDSAKRVE